MFKLTSDYQPTGDQPEAIEKLYDGIKNGESRQVLLGVTGSGKTFTMAKVIEKYQKSVLVISHNKTLAAQLYSEFKAFFPKNSVEYFISYYDYYLPESYSPQTDTYIAKDASINEEIERLRLSATTSLLTDKDVIIVASVSCIYGLGSPDDYKLMSISLKEGMKVSRKELLNSLINIQYERNDTAPESGQFRVRGDVIDIHLPHKKNEFIHIEIWDDEIEKLTLNNNINGSVAEKLKSIIIPPVKHFVLPKEKIEEAETSILEELKERVKYFESKNMLIEAQRIYQRTKYDLEMMKEIGYCSGIENYSRHLSGREPGTRPYCLMDFLEKNFLLIIDESHVSLPQIRAMYNADRSRKQVLVVHGFRLPSALDNRPLNFEEFNSFSFKCIYVSATPGDYELEISSSIVEQIVRPTGLLEPEIEIRPIEGQIDDAIAEIRKKSAVNERVIITTLTKKSSEKLCDYFKELGIKSKYLHSEINALERVEILTALRKSEFDCLIGVNLLREGLDLPEVSMVLILDADKEGFLRSEKSLIQVSGRAARNEHGKVILYADKITPSIKKLIDITEKRRAKQIEYNKQHNIIPKTIYKEIREDIAPYSKSEVIREKLGLKEKYDPHSIDNSELITVLETEMLQAAETLEFERAALLRDRIKEIKNR